MLFCETVIVLFETIIKSNLKKGGSMSCRKFLVILFSVAFVIGAVGSAYALDGNAVMTQYHCTGCHGTSTIKGTDNASTVTKIMDSIAPGGAMYGMTSYG